MKIIVGLGNPGKQYANNRHNTGFMTLNVLHKKLEATDWKEESKFKATISEATVKGEKVLLAKPLTFMNLSGEAIVKILNFYKTDLSDLTVIYDDLDLPTGTIRIRDKGSAGTHNGMKSIIQLLGSEEFKRIRIGIESRGTLAPDQQDTSSYVLSDFSNEEKVLIDKAIDEVVDHII